MRRGEGHGAGIGELRGKKLGGPPLAIVPRVPRPCACGKADVSAPLGKLGGQRVVAVRDGRHVIEHIGWKERVVDGTEQERWSLDTRQKWKGAGSGIVVGGITEPVQRRRELVVEFPEGGGLLDRGEGGQLLVARDLGQP